MANRRSYLNSGPSDGTTVLVGCLLVILLFLVALAVGTFITYFGWNLGVVAIVAACGGMVSKISVATAFFVNLALNIVRGIFKSSFTVNK